MSKFDDLLQEAEDAGVDPGWIERLKDASPLRAEKKDLEKQLQEATDKANKYRSASLRSQFDVLGIKVKPDALNVPADLDPLDSEGVRSWAVDMGLAEPAPPATPVDEQAGHQAIAEASSGAAPPPRHDARAEVLAAKTEEEFDALARAAGFMK